MPRLGLGLGVDIALTGSGGSVIESDSYLLLESDEYILLESGDYIILE